MDPLSQTNDLHLAALLQQIASLQQRLDALSANPAQSPTCALPLKINSPKEFSGTRLEARSFLAQCELAFRANPANFPLDDEKVVYAASYLRKDVFLWFQTQNASLTTPFTWYTFQVSFLEAWGEADEAQTAKDKLKRMKQKGACSTYVTEFNHYALLAQFDELALKELFYDGLKEGVKDLLLTLPEVTTLYKYQKQAVKCDI
jgi:hypothetical protein